MSEVVVLKFGSSVLRGEADLPAAVDAIYRHVRAGRAVVAVVSALGDTTDALVARGAAWSDHAQATAALLATGEAVTTALLGLALDRAGVPCEIFDAARAGLITQGPLCDAAPVALDTQRFRDAFERVPVIVLPGFLGRDSDGRTTLLGRGGSDLTALFVAWKLGAACRLLKDVDGIYDADPALVSTANRFSALCWDDAARLGGCVVQPKGVRWAQERSLCFEVGCLGSATGTLVGPGPNVVCEVERGSAPTRVVLLGLGTVGLGVYQALRRNPQAWQVVAVAVNDAAKHVGEVPRPLLCDAASAVAVDADVVVECIGGVEPARSLIAAALDTGRDVVTANKAVIARHGADLAARARRRGVSLCYSAAVGGSVPVVEHVKAARGVQSIEAVLNGTCNFVLDRLHDGVPYPQAVREAQDAGFAEADPTLDLDGTDSAHKIAVLVRDAFGVEPVIDWVPRSGLDILSPAQLDAAKASGGRVRLVARCERTETGVHASVRTEVRAADDPLARARREANCAIVRTDRGTTVLRGKGAGRWPTALAVVADLSSLRDARAPHFLARAL